jgi:hypothetical protein
VTEEFVGSCALLQESPMRQRQVHPVIVDRNHFGQHHRLYEKLNYPSQLFEYLRMEIETLLE